MESPAVLVDTSAPADFTVEDGTDPTRDADAQSSASELWVQWAFSEPNGTAPWGGGPPVAYWEVAITRSPCLGAPVAGFVRVDAEDTGGNGTDGRGGLRRFAGLALQPQGTYFACVRAWTATGRMTQRSSDGIVVDLTPPQRGLVRVPLGLAVFEDAVDMDVEWTAWEDPEAEVVGYRLGVGSRPGARDVYNATELLPPGNRSAALTLEVGQAEDAAALTLVVGLNGTALNSSGPAAGPAVVVPRYAALFVVVIGLTEAGLSTAATSAAIVLDSTPPESVARTAWVKDGVAVTYSAEAAREQAAMPDVQYTPEHRRVTCSWSPWRDPQGLREYEWGIGTSPAGAPGVVPWTSSGNETVVKDVPARLEDGVTYYCMVCLARHGLGLRFGGRPLSMRRRAPSTCRRLAHNQRRLPSNGREAPVGRDLRAHDSRGPGFDSRVWKPQYAAGVRPRPPEVAAPVVAKHAVARSRVGLRNRARAPKPSTNRRLSTLPPPSDAPSTAPVRQLLGTANAQTAHPAATSTAPAHQPLGSANAETTPAGALAAAADRTQRPDTTCEGKNG